MMLFAVQNLSLPFAGRCGNGPNLVLEARGEAGSELALSHVSTPARLAEALRAFTPLDVSEGLLKVGQVVCDCAGCGTQQRWS